MPKVSSTRKLISLENLHKFKRTAKSYVIQQQPKYHRYQWRKQYPQQQYQQSSSQSYCPSNNQNQNRSSQLLLLPPPSNHKRPHNDSSHTGHLLRNQSSIFDLNTRLFKPWQTIRLAPFFHNWAHITKDSWILNIIQFGYHLESAEFPPLGHVKFTSFDPVLGEEILTLLKKMLFDKHHHGTYQTVSTPVTSQYQKRMAGSDPF